MYVRTEEIVMKVEQAVKDEDLSKADAERFLGILEIDWDPKRKVVVSISMKTEIEIDFDADDESIVQEALASLSIGHYQPTDVEDYEIDREDRPLY